MLRFVAAEPPKSPAARINLAEKLDSAADFCYKIVIEADTPSCLALVITRIAAHIVSGPASLGRGRLVLRDSGKIPTEGD